MTEYKDRIRHEYKKTTDQKISEFRKKENEYKLKIKELTDKLAKSEVQVKIEKEKNKLQNDKSSSLKKQYDTKINNLKKSFEMEKANIKLQIENKYKDSQVKDTKQIDALNKQHLAEISKIQTEHAKLMQSMHNKIDALQEKYDKAVQEIEEKNKQLDETYNKFYEERIYLSNQIKQLKDKLAKLLISQGQHT
jgi:chromosome segregation ATPase